MLARVASQKSGVGGVWKLLYVRQRQQQGRTSTFVVDHGRLVMAGNRKTTATSATTTTTTSRFVFSSANNNNNNNSHHRQQQRLSTHSTTTTTTATQTPTPTTTLVVDDVSIPDNRAASSSLVVGEEDEEQDRVTLRKKAVSTTTTATKIKAYLELAKARLSLMVVSTTAAGFVAAGIEPLSTRPAVLAAVLTGTALCSSSAAAWNQIFELQRDERMKRTQQRPLVTGTLTLPAAVTAATIWGVTGTSILTLGTDPTTAALGVGNIVLYAGLYTAMKPVSISNTWVGAVVGAIPPVMGWTAATGGNLFAVEPALLGSLLYLWQLPHFMALSYMHRMDYKRGGFAMLPCLEPAGVETAAVIVRYTWYLSAVPMVATVTGVTSSMFALEGLVLNAYALHKAYQFQYDRTNAKARQIFLTSLWYLPCTLMLFLLHSKIWDEQEAKQTMEADNKENNKSFSSMGQFVSDHIHWIREMGRAACIHESVVAKTDKGEESCPVALGTLQTRKTVHAVVETAVVVSSQQQQQAQEQQKLLLENKIESEHDDDDDSADHKKKHT